MSFCRGNPHISDVRVDALFRDRRLRFFHQSQWKRWRSCVKHWRYKPVKLIIWRRRWTLVDVARWFFLTRQLCKNVLRHWHLGLVYYRTGYDETSGFASAILNCGRRSIGWGVDTTIVKLLVETWVQPFKLNLSPSLRTWGRLQRWVILTLSITATCVGL